MNAKTNAKTTVNAKTTAKSIVCALLSAALTVGAAPALADECGTWDFEPIEHSDYALMPYDQAIEVAVAALPINGWDDVASINWSFFYTGIYNVEVHATSGRWWIVWVDSRTGNVEAIL
jgi:hypothetical protein